MHTISCIIVDYYKAQKVVNNIGGLIQQEGNFYLEIIVVDNSCSKKNVDILKKNILNKKNKICKNIKLIINNENVGYSKANNQAAKKATGDFILVLNPDIEWEKKNTLQTMLTYLQNNPDVGILGPRQEERSGYLALSVRAFPKWHVQVARRTFLKHIPFWKKQVHHDEMRHLDRTKIQEVDWLQSSCFLLSNNLWIQLGGFNEQYFLFLADTEICKKCWQIGKKVIYLPKSTVYSDGIRCSDGGFLSIFTSPSLRAHIKDSWNYFRNNSK